MDITLMNDSTADLLIGGAPADDNPLVIPRLLEDFVNLHADAGTMPSKRDDTELFAGVDELETVIADGFADIYRALALLLAEIRLIGTPQ